MSASSLVGNKTILKKKVGSKKGEILFNGG